MIFASISESSFYGLNRDRKHPTGCNQWGASRGQWGRWGRYLSASFQKKTSIDSEKGRTGKDKKKEEGTKKERHSRENPQSVGMSQTTLPSLNSHDSSIRLNDTQLQGVSKSESDSVIYVNLPLTLWYTPWFGVVNGVNTSGEVELSGSLLASSYYGSAVFHKRRKEEGTYHR